MSNWKSFLPSIKLIMVVVSLLLLGGLIWGGTYLGKILESDNAYKNKPLTGMSALTNEIIKSDIMNINKDSDNDGLKDWEETLWKTDADKTDTDGDKTNDGAEVATSRDPLKPNTAKSGRTPDDFLDISKVSANLASATSTPLEPKTKTDKLARDFIVQYFSIKGNAKLTVAEQDKLVADIMSKTDLNSDFTYKKYTEKDISKISGQLSKAVTDKYKQDILKALDTAHKKSGNGLVSEFDIILKAFENQTENQDSSEINKLAPIIKEYQLIVKEVLKIKVPNDLAKKHLDFLNNISAVSQGLPYIKENFEDPLSVFIFIEKYKNFLLATATALDKLGE